MSNMTEERRAELARATERARAVLKPGDRITYTHCPGTKRWGIFASFGRAGGASWINTRTRDDVHAIHISKVNGVAVDFSDAGSPA